MTAQTDTLPVDLEAAAPPRRWNARGAMEILVPLLALVVLVSATAGYERWHEGTSNFLTVQNVLNLLRQYSIMGVVALGMTFVVISGGIDLSVGSIVAMAGVLGLWAMNVVVNAQLILTEMGEARQFNSMLPNSAFTEWMAQQATKIGVAGSDAAGCWIGIGAMLMVAICAGMLNGLLIAKGRIEPFIATLGGYAAYRSIALTVADGSTLAAASKSFARFNAAGIQLPFEVRPDVPAVLHYPVVVFFGLAVLGALLLNTTRYGRYVVAIGSNERSAVYSAINVDRVKVLTYLLIGFTCGAAALLLVARQNSVPSSQAGSMYELDAIAAVVIGGTRMSGGRGTIFGTVIGVLILGVIGNMLSFLAVSPYLQGLVKGVIIVVAVLIQRIGRRS